jgi:hypothetical protein
MTDENFMAHFLSELEELTREGIGAQEIVCLEADDEESGQDEGKDEAEEEEYDAHEEGYDEHANVDSDSDELVFPSAVPAW